MKSDTSLILACLCLSCLSTVPILPCGCRKGDRSARPARETRGPDARATTPTPRKKTTEWYAEGRRLYRGIPTVVRFTPANTGLADRVWAYLDRVDRIFNAYSKKSEVGRLNDAAEGAVIRVSEDFVYALGRASRVRALTGGAFDVTVGPVHRLWKNAAKRGKPPTRMEIRKALKAVGADMIRLEGRLFKRTRPGRKFDFGGIVKGIAADRVIAMLRKGRAKAAYVQIGGEISAYGVAPHGKPHQLGVQNPLEPKRVWTAVRGPETGISASTSGNIHNPVRIGRKVYYHIVDPRTGMPVDTRVLSVNVVFTRTGMNWLADGLSTAAAVMGPEKALKLIERLKGQALILVKKGDGMAEFKTKGWDGLVIRR